MSPAGPLPRAAFYTPLKHPFWPEVSGDRELGRALLGALRAAGLEPQLASRLRTWRRRFDANAAARLERAAAVVATTLVGRYRRRAPADRPRLWMTYQNYHRCPDLLGPAVATALSIPYVLVDPSLSATARRTAFRPWASAARLAVRRADLIFAMSPRDVPALSAYRGARFSRDRLRLLPPAVDLAPFDASPAGREAARQALRARVGVEGDEPLLLCVAMMRPVDKLDSYRLLAAALAGLLRERPATRWHLVVVGDGAARADVEAALATLPHGRVTQLGALPPDALPPVYRGADLLAFPGIGEEFGLVYLEAAAAALPVVACHGPGPDWVVAPGGGILTAPTPGAFSDGLRHFLDSPALRREMGDRARDFVARERTRGAFERRVAEGLAGLGLP